MTLLVLFNQPSGGPTNYSITANVGSYVVSGVAATIARDKKLVANTGSYSYSGVSATVARNKVIGASTGAYTVAGVAATITYTPVSNNYTVTASAGAYTVSGKTATITYASAGGAVWPNPATVKYGVVYGPTGADYTGTYIGEMTFEINTGQMIKPLTSKLSTLL